MVAKLQVGVVKLSFGVFRRCRSNIWTLAAALLSACVFRENFTKIIRAGRERNVFYSDHKIQFIYSEAHFEEHI